MGLFSGIVSFVFVWWLVFFITLPIGSRSYHEADEETEVGHARSAPLKPRIWLKIAIATPIAAAVWGVLFYLFESGAISIHP